MIEIVNEQKDVIVLAKDMKQGQFGVIVESEAQYLIGDIVGGTIDFFKW